MCIIVTKVDNSRAKIHVDTNYHLVRDIPSSSYSARIMGLDQFSNCPCKCHLEVPTSPKLHNLPATDMKPVDHTFEGPCKLLGMHQ